MGFVKIIHPGLGPGSVSEVPDSSLTQWYASGWRLLAPDEVPPQPEPAPEPEPMTLAEAAAAASTEEES